MKNVELTIDVHSWYAHAKLGGMRWTYYGGTYTLSYKDKYKRKYVDPHTEKYRGEDSFIMDMVNEAIALLKEPCYIKLSLPERSFPYDIIRKGVYEYWKNNNWCFKSGAEASKHWIEFDRLLTENGHIVEVV